MDLNEYYANAQTPPLQQTTNQQQHPQNTQIPAFIYHHPAQAAHLQGGLNTPPELMHPHLSHQQRNAIHSALLQQQQQQQQNQSTNGSTNDLSTTSLYNGPQLSGPQVNRPVEFVSAQSGGPPLMQPQYILDPTGGNQIFSCVGKIHKNFNFFSFFQLFQLKVNTLFVKLHCGNKSCYKFF